MAATAQARLTLPGPEPARPADPRGQLPVLLRRALLLRLLLAVVLHLTTTDYTFAPDQETYHLFAERIARYWTGDLLISPEALLRQGEPPGYYYVVASLYTLLGSWPLLPKLVNAVIGAYTVRLVFDLTLSITGAPASALLAARYTAYFPSLVLWSVLNIRDIWVALLILLICRQASRMQARPSLPGFVVLACAILAITQFRSYLLFAITLPMLISFFVRQKAHLVRNTVLGMLVAGAIIYADAAAGRNRRMRMVDWEDLNASRRWSSGAAQSGFEQDADISSPEKALAFLPVGLTYFMLAPFPWTVANVRQGFTIPEMLFFYSLVPAMLRGLRVLTQRHLAGSLMILLIAGGITFGYAVGQGNVGTIYRHRAQVLPFYLMFAAVGIEEKRRQRLALAARQPPGALAVPQT